MLPSRTGPACNLAYSADGGGRAKRDVGGCKHACALQCVWTRCSPSWALRLWGRSLRISSDWDGWLGVLGRPIVCYGRGPIEEMKNEQPGGAGRVVWI